jgi:ribosome assembly protein RRB1
MAKRPADSEQEQEAIKNGDRPMDIDQDDHNEAGEFADEFEDEFESEDEIFEAGVDGRPDEEREAEERESTCWSYTQHLRRLTISRWHGR